MDSRVKEDSSLRRRRPEPNPIEAVPVQSLVTDERPSEQTYDTSATSWASATRNLAVWRMIFFSIMTFYELGNPQILTPFGSLDLELDMEKNQPGKDRWFGYNQFDWLQDLHYKLGKDSSLRAELLNNAVYILGILAAFGKELKIPGWRAYTGLFTLNYLIRYLVKATSFTNHNYLFPLLMILSIWSGGGHLSGKAKQREIHLCETATVALRAQFALLYGFASLWKLHGDWLAGRIVRSIFLSFEERRKHRGVPWAWLGQVFPPIFQFLALSGLILDASMFFVLTFFRPTTTNTRMFLTFTLLFHVFTTFTMGEVIGYSFPGTCMAGITLFLPFCRQRSGRKSVSYDHSLVEWMRLYWTRAVNDLFSKPHNKNDTVLDQGDKNEKEEEVVEVSRETEQSRSRLYLIVIGWLLWQTLFPLRMIYVSGGNFPFNRLGYRYSWTMMLHNLDFGIVHNHGESAQPTVLLLSYLVPTCFLQNGGPDVYMPRAVYMGHASEHLMQDSRTVPLHMVLNDREAAMLSVFPVHFLSRIASGFAKIIDQNVGADACAQKGAVEQRRMGIHAVYFGRLNQNGPYSRLIDPTVDLVLTAEAQAQQSYWTTLWKSLWDQRPAGHEFLLQGIGSLRAEGLLREAQLKQSFPGATVALVADRAACLQPRPLWFRPMAYGYMVIPLVLPTGVQLVVRAAEPPSSSREPNWKEVRLWPGQSELLKTVAMEIGLIGPKTFTHCGETSHEDVLFALLYQEE